LIHPAYVGQVRYKTEVHPGEHEGIVDPEVWQRVQELLHHNGPGRNLGSRVKSVALLKGLLRCQPCGKAMSPTYARNGTTRYNYYLCLDASKHGSHRCPSRTVSAPAIEAFVVQQLHGLARAPTTSAEDRRVLEPFADLATWQAMTTAEQAGILNALLQSVNYDGSSGQVTLIFQETSNRERNAE
jgi:site-specific DNA recombinase